MGKGEIPCFEQFLLLSKCFQKSSAAEASESVYMWERIKHLLSNLKCHQFGNLRRKISENKNEIFKSELKKL